MTNDHPAIARLTMSRSMCFGPCPAYEMTLNADGLVTYEGKSYVIKQGQHNWTISAPRMRALGRIIGASQFFSAIEPSDLNRITCVATIDLTIEMDDGRVRSHKDIYDWPVVDDLAVRIDKYCGVCDYAYRPLVRYRMTAATNEREFQRIVDATGPDHARQVLTGFLAEKEVVAEMEIPASVWRLCRLGYADETYPACYGAVDGHWIRGDY